MLSTLQLAAHGTGTVSSVPSLEAWLLHLSSASHEKALTCPSDSSPIDWTQAEGEGSLQASDPWSQESLSPRSEF